jgi:hypothetical protein
MSVKDRQQRMREVAQVRDGQLAAPGRPIMARRLKSPTDKVTSSAALDANDAFEQGHTLLADDVAAEYPAAMACLRIAAEQGHAQARNDLATMLRDGLGCAPDIEEAIHWYQLSAAQDEPAAQYNLGLIYLHGIGLEPDKALAAEYLLQAANAGDAAAMRELGTMLRLGDGIGKNIVVAAWLHLGAAEDGDVTAIGDLAAYFRELVRPALEGNVHAARALHRVYRDGFGHDANEALAWAWIRWAHDACLLYPGILADAEADAVREDYAQAMNTIGPTARKKGDDYLDAIVKERESASSVGDPCGRPAAGRPWPGFRPGSQADPM